MKIRKRRSAYFEEWRSIFGSRKLLVAVTAIALVPLLYSSMFLYAFWDPYGHLDRMPVAVVNQDAGAELNGEPVKVGEQFVDQLKKSGNFDWRFVDEAEAMDGLKHNRYYIGLEIPENFSEQAVDVLNVQPDAAKFRYYPNEGYNFLSSMIGKSAIERMKSELSQELTQLYAQTIFTTFSQVSDGLASAADGAAQLSEGSQAVNAGLAQVNQSLGRLADGTVPVADGAAALTAAAGQLQGGLADLQTATGQLAGGLTQLREANGSLAQGAAQSEQGLAQLRSGLTGAEQASAQVSAGAGRVSAGLAQWAASHPDLAQDETLQQLLAASRDVATGAEAQAAAGLQLSASAAQLAGGGTQLAQGLDAFGRRLAEADAGGAALLRGAQAAAAGGASLQHGLAELSGGVSQLAEGASQLKSGAGQLADGTSRLASGSAELSNRLQEASGQTADVKTSDATYEKIASPVQVEEDKLATVPNYGTGLAPYFVSLGLFVGCMLLTIIYSVRDTSAAPRSGFSWFLGKWGTMLTIGFVQAVVVDLVLLYGLGIEVRSVPYFFLFSILTSWTFMSLIQLLVSALGDPGRFIAILILILQLTTSAGTFPLELIPEPLQHFSAWLPMTYTVSGYRAVISSGDFGLLSRDAWILGAYGAGFTLLTAAVYQVLYRKQKRQDGEPSSPALTV